MSLASIDQAIKLSRQGKLDPDVAYAIKDLIIEESCKQISERINPFYAFFVTEFAQGFYKNEGAFVSGEHLRRWCERLNQFLWTITLSARDHSKSTLFAARVLYRLKQWKEDPVVNFEAGYMSFTHEMAARHLGKIKQLAEATPGLLDGAIPLSPAASILKYRIGQRTFNCIPMGIGKFKRGMHLNALYVDDPLKDSRRGKSLDVSQIQKITDIFMEEIVKIPKPGAELHVIGTPQDKTDLFFKLMDNEQFNCEIAPCVQEETTGQILFDKSNDDQKKWKVIAGKLLWPEMYSYQRLTKDLGRMGWKAFSKEMMCTPRRTEELFLTEDQYRQAIERGPRTQPSASEVGENSIVVGGWDLGKKTHPSHVAFFEIIPDVRDEECPFTMRQVYSRFLDQQDYSKQLPEIYEMAQAYRVQVLAYDNTREEFETFRELGQMPRHFEGIKMTSVQRSAIATDLEYMFVRGKIGVIADEHRQRESVLSVDDQLNAPVTAAGHGDAFFSIALCCHLARTRYARRKSLWRQLSEHRVIY